MSSRMTKTIDGSTPARFRKLKKKEAPEENKAVSLFQQSIIDEADEEIEIYRKDKMKQWLVKEEERKKLDMKKKKVEV